MIYNTGLNAAENADFWHMQNRPSTLDAVVHRSRGGCNTVGITSRCV